VYAKTPYDDFKATEGVTTISATGTNSAESSARRGAATTDNEHQNPPSHHGKSHGGSGGHVSGERSSRSAGDGNPRGSSWKRASKLITMQGGGDGLHLTTGGVNAEQSLSDGKSLSPGSAAAAAAAAGGGELLSPHQSQHLSVTGDPEETTPTKRTGPRPSISGRPGSCDPRQLQKRTEALEQLSAFLQ